MKAGVATSVVAHAALLVLALAGLGAAQPLEPEIVESIAVELVPISEVTNIRMGSLESTVVETETPAVVETETPAELAEPTGNTTEDQVTPQETAAPTPAPVINTAPEPVAEPTPEPEPEPVKEPPPTPAPAVEPEPAPVEEAPAPEVATEAAPEAPATAVAPMPAMRPAQLQKAPAKKEPPKETKVAEAKPPVKTPAPTPKKDVQKAPDPSKEADLNDLIKNLEKSRGATTGEGGQATLGKNDGRAATLTQSQLDGLVAKIKGCFNLLPSMMNSTDTTRLVFSLDGGGNLVSDPQIASQLETTTGRALASAAKRAVMRCGPYPMAAGQDVGATFTAEQLS